MQTVASVRQSPENISNHLTATNCQKA